MDDYRLIADRLAADIADGRLRAGERLLPQRRFARTHGIASSTAARVYAELIRRGLAVGEVGRGTFVRHGPAPAEPALAEPAGARVDLELNFPLLPGQPELLAASLGRLARPDALAGSLRPVGATGTPPAREAAAALLAGAGWNPEPGRMLFAGNGRQAIAASVAALVRPGGRLGVEPLTYPVVKGVAARLGVTLVPLTVDEAGPVPDALASAAPHAVYLQPTLHNPVGRTIPAERRVELAETLRRKEIYAIEDAIYGFLAPGFAPLAGHAPDRVVLVDSLSKRLAPGLTLGFAIPPAGLADRLAAALRSGGWAAARFALDAATQWITDGTAAEIAARKRADAQARQRIMRDGLAGFAVHADERAYHCWWELPDRWRAEAFAAAAARRGIAITPAAAFAIGAGHAPNAVRLALSAPPPEILAAALGTLAALARTSPEDAELELSE